MTSPLTPRELDALVRRQNPLDAIAIVQHGYELDDDATRTAMAARYQWAIEEARLRRDWTTRGRLIAEWEAYAGAVQRWHARAPAMAARGTDRRATRVLIRTLKFLGKASAAVLAAVAGAALPTAYAGTLTPVMATTTGVVVLVAGGSALLFLLAGTILEAWIDDGRKASGDSGDTD